MKHTIVTTSLLAVLLLPGAASAQNTAALKQALTFHASFDQGFDADFSRGEKGALSAPSKAPCRWRRTRS